MKPYTDHNRQLTDNARKLRKSMTEQERKLWYLFLRKYPVKFYRQRVIGTYIADFMCSRAHLIIEVDGGQHYFEENLEVEEVNLDEEVCEIMTVEQEINLWKNRADKAYDEGLAEGEKVGAEKEIQSIIEKMRANGMSEDLIAQIVG